MAALSHLKNKKESRMRIGLEKVFSKFNCVFHNYGAYCFLGNSGDDKND